MKKCKNIECNNEIPEKRTYCSLTCRNVYVNKHMRDYSKNAEALSRKAKEEYKANPKFCQNPNCGKKIPYSKRENIYCNNSCKASHVNTIRDRKESSPEVKEKLRKLLYENWVNSDANNRKSAEEQKEYEKNPSKCLNCGTAIEFRLRNQNIHCSKKCKDETYAKTVDPLQLYRRKCRFKFNLSDYSEEFDFSLIEEHGWYSPSNKKNNLGGVSRDHIFSVREGFDKGIDPNILAHPANCRLMVHNDNISKNSSSQITLEELLTKIEEFNKKYNIK